MKVNLFVFIIHLIVSFLFSSEMIVKHFRYVEVLSMEGKKIIYIFINMPYSNFKFIKEIFIVENLYVSFESLFPGILSKDYKSDMEVFIGLPRILTIKYFANNCLKEYKYFYYYDAKENNYFLLNEKSSKGGIEFIKDKVLERIDKNYKEAFRLIFRLRMQEDFEKISKSKNVIDCKELEGKFGDCCDYWEKAKYKNKIQYLEIKLDKKNDRKLR